MRLSHNYPKRQICSHTQRVSWPSNFRALVKRTVLAGMFKPMANVSVAKSALMRPSPKRISVVSLRMGRRPPWWMPIPRFKSGRTFSTCGSARSSSDKTCIAFWKTSSTNLFSSAGKKWNKLILIYLDKIISCTIEKKRSSEQKVSGNQLVVYNPLRKCDIAFFPSKLLKHH